MSARAMVRVQNELLNDVVKKELRQHGKMVQGKYHVEIMPFGGHCEEVEHVLKSHKISYCEVRYGGMLNPPKVKHYNSTTETMKVEYCTLNHEEYEYVSLISVEDILGVIEKLPNQAKEIIHQFIEEKTSFFSVKTY